MSTVHVIGAGISGLSCAVRCALAGRKVVVYEAAPQAGGRCRSYMDDGLGCVIDNGNHMLLGASEATRGLLSDIGSSELLTEIRPAAIPFFEMETGGQWTLRPTASLFPFWLFDAKRRVPGTNPSDYLEVIRLARAGDHATVAQYVDTQGPLYERLWQPVCRAALNTDATEASAKLLWRVIATTLVKGEAACRPLLFSAGLSPTLIDPALQLLRRHDCEVRFQSRARGIRWHNDRAIALHFPEGLLALELDDVVVLAVPPEICLELWPSTEVPDEYRTIVNVHYRMGEAVDLPGGCGMVGIIGGTAQWLFVRGDVLSVTISAADEIAVQPNWEIANQLWAEVARVLGRNMGRIPAWRVIKERRATIAQTPAQIARRPDAETVLKNLFIAGDWTDTGLPATIEGSVQSGFEAARLALRAVRTLGQEE